MEQRIAKAGDWQAEAFGSTCPLDYRTTYSKSEFEQVRRGLIPEAMEDKWFIYYEAPYLFFHLSWTGRSFYRLSLKETEDGAEVVDAEWATQLADQPAADTAYQSRLLHFMVSNMLLGKREPFPRPANLKEPMPGAFQHHISGTGYPER